MIHNIRSYDEYKDLSKGTALIKLGAQWCGPCKVLDATLEKEFGNTGDAIFKVDVDNLPQIASELGVMSIPTIVMFVDGTLVSKVTGSVSKDEIQNQLNKGRG